MGVVVDADIELGRYPAARAAIERLLRQRPDLASYSRASYYLELHGRTAAARRALVQATQAGAPVRREHRLGVSVSREPRVQPRPLRRGREATTGSRSTRIRASSTPGPPRRSWRPPAGSTRRAIAGYTAVVERLPAPGLRDRARRRLPGGRQARRGPAPVRARARRGAALRGQRRERRRRARPLRRRPQRGRGRRARADPGRRAHPAERHGRGRPRVDALQGRPRARGAGRVEPGAPPGHPRLELPLPPRGDRGIARHGRAGGPRPQGRAPPEPGLLAPLRAGCPPPPRGSSGDDPPPRSSPRSPASPPSRRCPPSPRPIRSATSPSTATAWCSSTAASVHVTFVLDEAEIPTFQDLGGQPTADRARAWAARRTCRRSRASST